MILNLASRPASGYIETGRTSRWRYRAKTQGRGRYKFYTTMMNADLARRILLERHLHEAVEHDEMFVHYQPILDTARDVVIGGEALLRWRSPALGVVSPSEFIGQAEHSGLIWSMGEFVLRRACADFLGLRNARGEQLRLSVNVSAHQVRRRGFADLVAAVLLETGFEPRHLQLEVTESLLTSRGAWVEKNLRKLRDMGVGLTMDDFGTGFSSLSYLSRVRFDGLKIDGRFVDNMGIDESDDAMVSAAIAIARAMNLEVVAEGVETQAQLHSLKDRNCRFAQGHVISPPLPLECFRQDILKAAQEPSSQPRLHLVRPRERSSGPEPGPDGVPDDGQSECVPKRGA